MPIRAYRNLFWGLVATLGAGCSTTLHGGWANPAPDPAPRAYKVSVRGPALRENRLIVGAEIAAEQQSEFRFRRAAGLVGWRLGGHRLGDEPLSFEAAAAVGGGRANMDPEWTNVGPLLGARADLSVPIIASPTARSSRGRPIYFRLDLVPYAHGDLIYGSTVPFFVEGGLGVRGTLGSDMAVNDLLENLL